MSDSNSTGLALFAELDNYFQDFSTADESTIAGGGKKKCFYKPPYKPEKPYCKKKKKRKKCYGYGSHSS